MGVNSNSSSNPARTYILLGDGFDNILHNGELEAAQRSGAVIIKAGNYKSLEDAVSAINTPANVILAAHEANNGTFRWRGDQIPPPYSELFSALPKKGVDSVTLESCYGGTGQSERFLKVAPAGTVIQSMVGPTVTGTGNFVINFTKNIHGYTNPTDLFISALATFHPKEHRDAKIFWNTHDETGKLNPGHPLIDHDDINPLTAMPHIIGFGGGVYHGYCPTTGSS